MGSLHGSLPIIEIRAAWLTASWPGQNKITGEASMVADSKSQSNSVFRERLDSAGAAGAQTCAPAILTASRSLT
jgi:hypothetical protein